MKLSDRETAIVDEALAILASKLSRNSVQMTSSRIAKDYLKLKLGSYECEMFAALYLDTKHRVIGYEELFQGSIADAVVHPRVLVKAALRMNAAAMIVAHNHPSGDPEPSQEDIKITKRVKDALELIDVRLLDHIVVAPTATVSLNEKGLL